MSASFGCRAARVEASSRLTMASGTILSEVGAAPSNDQVARTSTRCPALAVPSAAGGRVKARPVAAWRPRRAGGPAQSRIQQEQVPAVVARVDPVCSARAHDFVRHQDLHHNEVVAGTPNQWLSSPHLNGLRAPQCAKDRARSALPTGTAGNYLFQFISHAGQGLDSLVDIGQVRASQCVNITALQLRIVIQAQEAADLLQAEAQLAPAADESQPLDIGWGVGTVTAPGPRRLWHQLDAFVVTDGFQVAAACSSGFTDFHSHPA